MGDASERTFWRAREERDEVPRGIRDARAMLKNSKRPRPRMMNVQVTMVESNDRRKSDG